MAENDDEENDLTGYRRRGLVDDVPDDKVLELADLVNKYSQSSRVTVGEILKFKKVLLLLSSTENEYSNRYRIDYLYRRISEEAVVDADYLYKYVSELRRRLDNISGENSRPKLRNVSRIIGSLNSGPFAFLEELVGLKDNSSARSSIRIAEFLLDTISSIERTQVDFITTVTNGLSSVGEYQENLRDVARDNLIASQKVAVSQGQSIEELRGSLERFKIKSHSFIKAFDMLDIAGQNINSLDLGRIIARNFNLDSGDVTDLLGQKIDTYGSITGRNVKAFIEFLSTLSSRQFPVNKLWGAVSNIVEGSRFVGDNLSDSTKLLSRIVSSTSSAANALSFMNRFGDVKKVDSNTMLVMYDFLTGVDEASKKFRSDLLAGLRESLRDGTVDSVIAENSINMLESLEKGANINTIDMHTLVKAFSARLNLRFSAEENFFKKNFSTGNIRDYFIADAMGIDAALIRAGGVTPIVDSSKELNRVVDELNNVASRVGKSQVSTVDFFSNWLEQFKLEISFGILDEIRKSGLDVFNMIKNSAFLKMMTDTTLVDSVSKFFDSGADSGIMPLSKNQSEVEEWKYLAGIKAGGNYGPLPMAVDSYTPAGKIPNNLMTMNIPDVNKVALGGNIGVINNIPNVVGSRTSDIGTALSESNTMKRYLIEFVRESSEIAYQRGEALDLESACGDRLIGIVPIKGNS